MNWKSGIAVNVKAPEETPATNDRELFEKLSSLTAKLPSRDQGFAVSLCSGYAKYRSFTPKQRPYVVSLIAKAEAPPAPPVGEPGVVSGLDLSKIPSGMYAVETRRYKVDNVEGGKWAGWVFVKDGSTYGLEAKLGAQRPGSAFVPKGANAALTVADLTAIAADPAAASKRYGQITGSCGVCGRTLENPASVAAGIGPLCREKYGW